MKLRSGRILNPVLFKRRTGQKAIANLVKQMENIKLEKHQDEAGRIRELQTFFRFLFYRCCEDIANKERIDEIERTKGRKVTLDELIHWEADESSWQKTFQKVWFRMQRELPLLTLLQAFDSFMKYEHGSENLEYLKPFLRNYLHELYDNNDSGKMIKLMQEINHVKSHAFSVSDKKIYLQELASDLASQTINPLFDNHPIIISWDVFFQYSKSRCCYIPEIDGGRTVRKLFLRVCNFSMFSSPSYQYRILKTGETFTSPEKDIRKALFLHKKCTDKNAQPIAWHSENLRTLNN
ncbi:uncharacterized protein LOC116292058 [Actinia tenebrosa]|uniref:Uncharacterized protein LOC116292058 n=1 Tax=Actinia tenebrosa TaxID=6105 RepID=A0A6P8HH32_ACTTE|nr:uncharacterized protein LOC116292058 [Actinia tenebrosa]